MHYRLQHIESHLFGKHANARTNTHTHTRTQTHTQTHTHIFKKFRMNFVSQPPTVIHRKKGIHCNTLQHTATHCNTPHKGAVQTHKICITKHPVSSDSEQTHTHNHAHIWKRIMIKNMACYTLWVGEPGKKNTHLQEIRCRANRWDLHRKCRSSQRLLRNMALCPNISASAQIQRNNVVKSVM